MADNRPPSAGAPVAQVPRALVEQLQQVLAAHSGPSIDEGEVSRALRTIAIDAQAHGVRAEQLLASLKREFDGLSGSSTLASYDHRAQRLSYLVTTCVREYYAVYPGSLGGASGGTS